LQNKNCKPILFSIMKTIKVILENGNYLLTAINGTREEICAYYVGKFFNLGAGEKDFFVKAIRVEFL